MLNRVLLIDDSLTIHKIVELTMSRQLFELVTARTPEEGLQVALEQSPSIILIDSKLAEYAPTFMDQLYTVTGAGIVLLVSSTDKPNAEYLRQMHAVSSLVKPFNASALNAALESALQSTLEEPSTLEEASAPAAAPETLPLVNTPETLPLVSGSPVAEKEPLIESLEKNIEDEIMAAFEPLSTPAMTVQEMEVQEVEVAPIAEEPKAEEILEPEVTSTPTPMPVAAIEPEATEMPSTPAMIVTDKPMPTLYVEPVEASSDETPWEEILPPAADPTYAQSVQNTEVITSPGYKYDWLFADEESRAKMSSHDPSSPEERMAELDKILAEEIDGFTADFNEAYAKDDGDFIPAPDEALPTITAEDAIEHVDQLFADNPALDEDAPGVVIQEEEEDEMLQNESEEGLFGDVSYQDERELLSDLYSLLGEEQDIDEHMNVIEDAGDLEDATSVLRQEIEERHELMGMFDDMNQEIEDLATRLEEGSTAAPVYRDAPEEPAQTADNSAEKFRDAREENRSISPRAGQLIIELSKEDLAKIIQSSINANMLEALVKGAVQASLEKIVPELTEKIVREELRLIGDR